MVFVLNLIFVACFWAVVHEVPVRRCVHSEKPYRTVEEKVSCRRFEVNCRPEVEPLKPQRHHQPQPELENLFPLANWF